MRTSTLRWHIFLAMLAATGVACKPLLTPAVNLITDAIFIPGGSAITGLSLAFLLMGVGLSPGHYSGTKMAFLQGVLALFMGVSGYQGLFTLVSYTLPGLAIDLVMCRTVRSRLGLHGTLSLAGICGVLSGALATNAAFFNLAPLPFALFLMVGAVSGFGGSQLAYRLIVRLGPILLHNHHFEGAFPLPEMERPL